MRHRLFLTAASLLLCTNIAWAVNKTPSSVNAYILEPFRGAAGTFGSVYTLAVANHGYNLTVHENSTSYLDANYVNAVHIDGVLSALSSGQGWLLLATHGTETGFTVEVYPTLELRELVYASLAPTYNIQGQPDHIMRRAGTGGWYGIGLTPEGLAAYFGSSGTVVVNMVCFGSGFRGSWTNARAILDYQGWCNVPNLGNTTADDLFTSLDGQNGKVNRTLEYAYLGIAGSGMSISGDQNTVLSPIVSSIYPTPGSQLTGRFTSASIDFDCVMSSLLNGHVLIDGDPNVQVSFGASSYWTTTYQLVFGFERTTDNTSVTEICLEVNSSTESSGGLVLDGNQNPEGLSPRGPNGDHHRFCYVPDHIAAAGVTNFEVQSDVASWEVVAELNTAGYEIEGAFDAHTSPGISLGVSEAPGLGPHSVSVAGHSYPFYRLIEVETDGFRSLTGVASSQPATASPAQVAASPEPGALRERLESRPQVWMPNESSQAGRKLAIYAPTAFSTDVEQYVADYWRARGVEVVVVDIGNFPSDQDGLRTAIKNSIASYASSGFRYFHLIGDSNDWREIGGDLAPSLWTNCWQNIPSQLYPSGQPANDIVPTFIQPIESTECPRGRFNTYFTPYWFTDQPYSDTDDDGVPDVIVARWPVDSSSELLALALKMQTHNDGTGEYSLGHTAFLVGDVNYGNPTTGGDARAKADQLQSLIESSAPGQYISHLYETDELDPGSRNLATVDVWNTYPELVVLMSSNSNRYKPGYFFDKLASSNPFTPSMLPDHSPFVLAASCAAASWAWTEHMSFGTPVCEDMLVTPDKGAVAWLGPSVGSFQEGNLQVASEVVTRLFEDPARSMAESWLLAIQTVHGDYGGDLGVLETAQSYVFLGDPLSSFRPQPLDPPEWTPGGSVVCDESGTQYYPSVVSDGFDGATVVWIDASGGDNKLKYNRVNGNGTNQFGEVGQSVSSSDEPYSNPTVISDGSAGALVYWTGNAPPAQTHGVYGQRIKRDGSLAWGGTGTVITQVPFNTLQHEVAAVSLQDGATVGDSYVAWASTNAVTVQRLGLDGTLVWSPSVTMSGNQGSSPRLTALSNGALAIAWRTNDLNISVYNSNGSLRWSNLAVSQAFEFEVAASSADGVLLTWLENGVPKVQLFDATGQPVWQHGPLEITDLSAPLDVFGFEPDGAGGAFIAYGPSGDIYVEHVRYDGTTEWGPSGLEICVGPEWPLGIRTASADGRGIFLTWSDDSSGAPELYAQRVESALGMSWYPSKVAVTLGSGYQTSHNLAPNGAGSAIAVWADSRTGNYDVYAARVGEPSIPATITSEVLKDGQLLPMPENAAFAAPAGGEDTLVVTVRFDASEVSDPITAEQVTMTQPLGGTSLEIYSPLVSDHDPVDVGGAWETTFTLTQIGGCGCDSTAVLLNGVTVGFAHLNVKTPNLMTSGTFCAVDIVDLSEFAMHMPPGPPDECTDFLPPFAGTAELEDLAAFAFHYPSDCGQGGGSSSPPVGSVVSGGVLTLDFEEDYPLVGPRKLYVAVGLEQVEPYEIMYVALRNDNPVLQFSEWQVDQDYPYWAYGFDVSRDAGNQAVIVVRGGESLETDRVELGRFVLDVSSGAPLQLTAEDFALVTAEFLTHTPDPDGPNNVLVINDTKVERSFEPASFSNRLGQNYPNPFNPTTVIPFSVGVQSHVELGIYNVKGQLVRRLVNEVRAENNYKAAWDGKNDVGTQVSTGVYFYRLTIGDFRSTKKLVLLK